MKLGIEELSIIVEGLRLRVKQLSSSVTEINQSIENLETEDGTKAPAIMQTTSPAGIASLSDGGEDMPIKSLKCTIVPVQAGTGDPAPDNIRPITGWTGVDVVRTGKNLYDWNTQAPASVPDQFAKQDGYGQIDFTAANNKQWNFATRKKLYPGSYVLTQVLSSPSNNVRTALYVYETGTTTLIKQVNCFGNSSTAFTIDSECEYGGSISLISAGTYSTDIRIQIEKGTSGTAYEPYTADSHSISFPSTVYGGWVDVVEGKLHVTHGYVDLGSMTWAYYTAHTQPYMNSAGIANLIKNPSSSTIIPDVKCSGFTNVTACAIAIGTATQGIGINSDGRVRIVYPNMPTDAEQFATAVTGQILVYELAEETIIDLDPVTIKTLLGNNNIYCNTGTVEVEYAADTKIYIDNAVAAVTPEPEPTPEPEQDEAPPEEVEEEEAEPEEAEEEEAEPAPEEEIAEEEEAEPEPVVKRATRKK